MASFIYAMIFIFVMQTVEHATACYPKARTPVNGGWAPWSQWTGHCPHQQQSRGRACNKPTPQNGGKPCVGPNYETRACPPHDSVSCGSGDCFSSRQLTWSTWNDWTTCSVTCGNGTKRRTRTCNAGTGCNGPQSENKTCSNGTCPVGSVAMDIDGEWTEWDPWSKCSVTCGGGIQRRNRNCSDPAPQNDGLWCAGNRAEIRNCAKWKCPNSSRTCLDGGNLTADFSICICNGTTINGMVTWKDINGYLPLSAAEVYLVGREWKPYTKSDVNGRFKVQDACTSGLKLIVKKPGYKSVQDSVDVNPNGWTVLEMRKLERPSFIVEPSSTTGFVGESAVFMCKATSVPAPTRYDWFKDGRLNRSETVNGTSGVVFNLTNLQPGDEGLYACRAGSEGGKRFSKLARLVVKESGNDTCDTDPAKLMVTLPQTCHIGGTNVTDIGMCRGDPCVKMGSSGSVKKCCSPIKTQQLNVSCNGFTYKLTKVRACGCMDCREISEIMITGKVKVKPNLPNNDVIVLYNGTSITVTDGEFSFEAAPRAGRVVFTVVSSETLQRLVTLNVEDGLSHIFVEVSLVRRPVPKEVDATSGGKLEVNSPGDLTSAVQVDIPPKAFVYESGKDVQGTVKVYLSYADPRDIESLESAAGEFTYEDEEGETRLLQTFGVVTVLAEDSKGTRVFLREKVKLKFNTTALGIENNNGKPNALLWVIDATSGQWKQSGALTYPGSSRRRKRGTNDNNGAEGETEIPRYVPYVNCDRPFLRGRLCSIAVYVYYGGDFSVPMSGQCVSAFMIENGRFIGRTSGTTDQNGKACLLVACGLQHIIRLESEEGVIVHTTHYLPQGFSFVNRSDGFEINATRPTSRQANLDGPVFLSSRWNSHCGSSNSSTFHFKLAKPMVLTSSLHDSLHAVETLPGRRLSWFPNMSSERKACALQMMIMTLNPSEIQVVGISSASSGELYGTYTSSLIKGHKACVLIRCPTNDSNYTKVDLQIAYANRSQCVFRYSTLLGSYMKDGITKHITHNNSSIQVQVDMPRADQETGIGFFSSTGKGDIAFYRVMSECTTGHQSVGIFDCSGSTIDPRAKSTINPRDLL